MFCQTCDKDRQWHLRQVRHIEETVGPQAALDFEQGHPEVEDDD